MKRVVCFGDSNTWGYDTSTGGRFDETIRWTTLLQKELGSEYGVIEEGLCGRTAVFEDPLNEGLNGLTYLVPCLLTHSPLDYLIIMLGTNDCKERFSATPQNIGDGMRRLITKAMHTPAWKDEKRILLVAPAPIEKGCERAIFAGEMGICSDKSMMVAAEYELVAKELGCRFYDAAAVVQMNHLDYMHMDKKSHARLAKELSNIISAWRNCEMI